MDVSLVLDFVWFKGQILMGNRECFVCQNWFGLPGKYNASDPNPAGQLETSDSHSS